MKKSMLVFSLLLALVCFSCIVQNPKRENCEVVTIFVDSIYEGGVKDVVFAEPNGDFYYINRGLEQGLILEELRSRLLNKKVTLHLAKVLGGITSEHISELALNNEVIYTEL